MIAVPDATVLPRLPPADARLELADDVRSETPAGTSETRWSRTMPIISQWPVTESLPADELSHAAERATWRHAIAADAATSARPSDRSVGTRSPTSRAMLPSVSLPSSPYEAASGSSPHRQSP